MVSSQGLKWEMDNTELRWGGLLSTSNEAIGNEFVIEADKPVLIIMAKEPKTNL